MNSSTTDDLWYWSPLSEDDQTGTGWIYGLTCLIVVFLTTITRLVLRKQMLGWEDTLICGSLVCWMQPFQDCAYDDQALYLGQSAALFSSFNAGLGKTGSLLDHEQKENIAKGLLACNVLGLSAHYLAKLSLAWLIRRLFFSHALLNSWACNVLLSTISICWLISIVLAGSSKYPIDMLAGADSNASSITREWTAITVLDVLTEFGMAVIPVYLIVTILRRKKQRILVAFVFLVRLPLCAFAVTHLYHLRQSLVDLDNIVFPLLASVGSLQLELLWSLVSASVPSLKAVVQPFGEIREAVDEKGHDEARPQGGFFYRGG